MERENEELPALCEKAERCGEQRAVEGIVRWLRDEAGKIIDIDEHLTYHLLADAIERGEWKERP